MEIGKLAGLYEGEGCFQIIKKPSGRHLLRCDFYTTDKDIAEWIGSKLNHKVYGPYKPSKASANSKAVIGKKPIWGVVVQGMKAAGLMMTILPLMGERRREKILHSLAIWKSEKLDNGNLAKLRHSPAGTKK